MSEQITLIIHGKFHRNDSIENRRLSVEKGENLLRLLKKHGCYTQDCSGNGTCGKCKVRFCKGAPIPTINERKFLSPEELRAGYRLACRHTVDRNAEIELKMEPAKLPEIVMDRETSACADEAQGAYFAAVDIGTTTVAMQAVSIKKAAVTASYTALNPQRSFGADVISRISAGMEGHLAEMSKAIRQCLAEGIRSLTGRCGKKPEYIVISANTTMNYLLRGLPVEVLGTYPFEPVDTSPVEWMLNLTEETAGIKTYLIPGFSAFVGGDIMAGILAQGIDVSDRYQLFLDLGTNGEIVLGRKGELLCTATAAGSAFEGGVSSQMLGADLIMCVAELLRHGFVDETGLLKEPYFAEGILMDSVRVRAEDIRNLQKAKAAIAAGIEILLAHCGISAGQVETVALAGGFGYYLDPESAIRIGLLPEIWRGRIRAVGNGALAGARLVGNRIRNREAFSNMFDRTKEAASTINLAEEKEFNEKYMAHINF